MPIVLKRSRALRSLPVLVVALLALWLPQMGSAAEVTATTSPPPRAPGGLVSYHLEVRGSPTHDSGHPWDEREVRITDSVVGELYQAAGDTFCRPGPYPLRMTCDYTFPLEGPAGTKRTHLITVGSRGDVYWPTGEMFPGHMVRQGSFTVELAAPKAKKACKRAKSKRAGKPCKRKKKRGAKKQ